MSYTVDDAVACRFCDHVSDDMDEATDHAEDAHNIVTNAVLDSVRRVEREERELATDGGKVEYREPVYKRDLLEEAKQAEEPVTEIEVSDEGRTTRVHAIQEYGGTAWRVMIRHYSASENSASVSFAKSHHQSDAKVMRDWTDMATGRLSGPKDLPSWESLFTVFNIALHEYNREVRADD